MSGGATYIYAALQLILDPNTAFHFFRIRIQDGFKHPFLTKSVSKIISQYFQWLKK